MTSTTDTSPLYVGAIIAAIWNIDSPPMGWLYCDGRSCGSYGTLAAMLKPNSPNDAVVPNLQGLTLIGATGASGDYAVSITASGQKAYGTAKHTLTEAEMPSHQHYGWGETNVNNGPSAGPWFGYAWQGDNGNKYYGSGGSDSDNNLYGSTFVGGVTTTADDDGNTVLGSTAFYDSNGGIQSSSKTGNDSFDLMQPSFAVNYFIYAGTYGT